VSAAPQGRRASKSADLLAAVADQGLSSGTNLLAVLVLARQLDIESFGVFSVAYLLLTLFLGAARSFVGLPISLSSAIGQEASRKAFNASWAALIVSALPIAGLVAGVAWIISGFGPAGDFLPILLVSLATPLILLQDMSRYFALATGRAVTALLADFVWLAGIVLIFLAPALPQASLFGAWLGAVVASLLVFIIAFRPRPAWRDVGTVLRPKRGLRESVTLTVVLSNATSLGTNALATPAYGLSLIGGLRGSSTLFGPVNTLITFLDFAVLPRIVKLGGRRRRRIMTATMAGIVVCTGIWITALLTLPDTWGYWILGETWNVTRGIILITSFEYVFLAVAAVLALSLKADGAARELLLSKVASSAVIILAVLIGTQSGASPLSVPLALVCGAIASCALLSSSIVRRSIKG
jgi:O-antigen/teichoic acid export membrane protein